MKNKLNSIFGMLVLVFLACVPTSTQTQRTVPTIGEAAPALRLEKLLQAPADASTDWDKLKDKAVVIEFWATWCGPCIGALPHLNQLATEFADKPVVFISVTDDDEERASGFLKKTPIKTWIGLDPHRTNWTTFDVHGIPTTLIINPAGKLVAMTTPENVTSQVLRDVLDGKKISLPKMETRDSNLDWDQDEIDWKDGVAPISEVIIKPISTATSGVWLRPEKNYLTADGAGLSMLVQLAYSTDQFHLDWRIPQAESEALYRVVARVPPGREQSLLPLFQSTLAATFAIKTSWEKQEKDVYVLRLTNGDPKLIAASASEKAEFSALRGETIAKRQPLAKLCEFLTNMVVHAPVIDETNLTGEYNWRLPYQPGQPGVATQAIKDQTGLELVKTRRPVNMLVVEPK
ncbi:MAG TPA: TIGR03435 family protein [Pyrinomonadaceae bacterium]|jgi:uncharacterized protein (TIGR03435 family)